MHIINLLQEALSSGIIRLIIAAILLVPFIYLITMKDESDEEEVAVNAVPSRSDMYHALYSQLLDKEEQTPAVVEMKQSDLAV